jgi:hypothetical protein
MRNKSSLLVVDVQARLLPAIADGEDGAANCIWLAGVAQRLKVPVVVSEQYPEGLGPTAAPLLAATEARRGVHQDPFFLRCRRLPGRHGWICAGRSWWWGPKPTSV